MSLATYKILASLLIFLVSIAVVYPLKKKHFSKHTETIELGEALASGLFLGAAFFHMLPDAIHSFQSVYSDIKYPIPEAICIGSFLLFLFLERISLNRNFSSHQSIPYVVGIILVVHAVVEGAALGIGTTFSETLLLLIAIIAHKSSESFALCLILLKYQLPLKRVAWMIVYFSAMTPLGIALGGSIHWFSATNHGVITAAIFNAFAAGTFLYISTLHHIQFHQHKEERPISGFVCLVLGVFAMGILAHFS